MVLPVRHYAVGSSSQLTAGQAHDWLTHSNFRNLASINSRVRCEIFLKLRRQRQLASVGLSPTALSLATVYLFPRGGPKLLLGHRFCLSNGPFSRSQPPQSRLEIYRGNFPRETSASGNGLFGSSAIRKWPCSVAVTRAAESGRLPRPPSPETTGEKVARRSSPNLLAVRQRCNP